MGDLRFYGRENAEKRGIYKFYARAYGSEYAKDDYFAIHLEDNEQLKVLYLDAEKDDGYIRDQSVFGNGISIEDTMGVMVKYRNKAILTYSLNAYLPWEGYRVSFNGSKGRIQVLVAENSYVNAGASKDVEGSIKKISIAVFPMFGEPYEAPVTEMEGSHGGLDPVLLNDIFGMPAVDRFKRAASHVDGAMSILTGIAANRSIATGMPIQIDSLVKF